MYSPHESDLPAGRDETCPLSTGGRTRYVLLVRGGGGRVRPAAHMAVPVRERHARPVEVRDPGDMPLLYFRQALRAREPHRPRQQLGVRARAPRVQPRRGCEVELLTAARGRGRASAREGGAQGARGTGVRAVFVTDCIESGSHRKWFASEVVRIESGSHRKWLASKVAQHLEEGVVLSHPAPRRRRRRAIRRCEARRALPVLDGAHHVPRVALRACRGAPSRDLEGRRLSVT